MQIEFYEEFPNKENLKKLKLINFPTKIFIASKSPEEFFKYEKIAKSFKRDIEIAYWPIIKNSYWISPFSNTKDLIELFSELDKLKNPLLIDLELPLRKRWKMYFMNILHFWKNKKLIKDFLENNKSRITTAEYIRSPLKKWTKFIGLDYRVKTNKSLMFYSSTINKETADVWRENIRKIKNKPDYSISLGIIARGILGNEPIISPENLEEDLEFVKKAGFEKVIIFRLEGINKEYIRVLKKFI
jgi:hypothetical protein